MSTLRYTDTHEWIRIEGDVAVIGLTPQAVEKLGTIVFLGFPGTGRVVTAGEAFAVAESHKTASEISAPMAGEITEINPALIGRPALLSDDPTGAGWIAKLRMSDPAAGGAGLLDQDAYDRLLRES